MELEPTSDNASEGTNPLSRSLIQHKLRHDEAESPALATAYSTVVAAFATSQKNLLRADHLSSHRPGGAPATDATDEGAARIDAMQQLMLSWKDEPQRPSAFDMCSAHAALVPGGGMLRTGAVRAGRTRFATPASQVQRKLEALVAALRTLSARDDVSPVAKAAWACYNLLALHPFADGNGRLARALLNMMLARHGVPFVVTLAASDSQRAAYRTALIASHCASDVRPWATLVAACVARAWSGLETAWQEKRTAAQAAAAGASARQARDDARRGTCMICLEEGVTCSLLCCGQAFHMRCLSQWLVSSGTTCPGCRAVVPPEERPAPPPPPPPPPQQQQRRRNAHPGPAAWGDDSVGSEDDDDSAAESAIDTTADDTEDDSEEADSVLDTTADDTTGSASFDDTTVEDEQYDDSEGGDDDTASVDGTADDDSIAWSSAAEQEAEEGDDSASVDAGDDSAAADEEEDDSRADTEADDTEEAADDTEEADDDTEEADDTEEQESAQEDDTADDSEVY